MAYARIILLLSFKLQQLKHVFLFSYIRPFVLFLRVMVYGYGLGLWFHMSYTHTQLLVL